MDLVIERGTPLPLDVTLHLPELMRDELKVPLGPVLAEEELLAALDAGGPLCTVGDMTTETAHRLGLPIQLAIVDYQTKRRPDPRWMEALAPVGNDTVEVANAPATISPALYNGIIDGWSSPTTVKIVVEGEEDMAALPAILHSPGGATVIYGIPDTGLCLVQVDEGAREVVADLLRRLRVRWGMAPP